MRAKNEFRNIAATYDTKLVLERVVDGKLMCPEACCGAPVVECTCGPDCPHCNCFMIHKAMKSKDFTDKLLKEFYKMRDPDGDGSWPDDEREEERRKNPDYGEPEYEDSEDSIVPEDERDEPIRNRDKNREFAASLFAKSPEERARSKRAAERVLGKRRVARPPHLFTKGEDNEEPKRGITGLSPRRSPELHSMKSHAIDKIDLNKWREYPAEDVMKAVYRRYGKELPSVDSYDWAITWDKKVRPWLKENEGNL